MQKVLLSLFLTSSVASCTPDNIKDVGDGLFYDEPSSVICTKTDGYCLPLVGKIGFKESTCTTPSVGYVDTPADYFNRYLTNGDIGDGPTFYELGDTVSEAITFYQFNDSKNCVVSTDDITTYRTIISADTDRNMFTKF
jgi:hypothetical protein